ncbi:nitroreductase family protein [Campylobacter fetus subsp. venerealis]|uniref:nitroreductase family protein n=1 Tax=Campylobacter fetus TaxID=196 RepID=UPI0018E6E231|nr:nitroreductase family protein [Campylobacter fetus]QQF52145.1 nitroreductase family protein [Campylobacter fetus subsp. venerealis]
MDTIQALKNRMSCRFFTDEQIKADELETIIECGLNAPSASNKQIAKIIAIQDKDTIAELSTLNSKAAGRNIDAFYGAKTVCLIVVPKSNENEEQAYLLNSVKDASLVIGAMQTAAYAIGIGSCWINRCKEMLDFERGQDILMELGLEDYEGVGCCILGYPAKELKNKKIKENRVYHYKK